MHSFSYNLSYLSLLLVVLSLSNSVLFLDATIYVGGLDEKVTDPILWELFLQAGPVGELCRCNCCRVQSTFCRQVATNASIDLCVSLSNSVSVPTYF